MGVPVVLLARPAVAGVDTISTENAASAGRLADHLLDHGYRRLAFLGDPASSPDAAARWEGVAAALTARKVRPRRPVPCAFNEQAGHDEAIRLLTGSGSRPEVLVCADDEIALGVLLAAEELGLRVPDDIAVTGWDDIMAARYTRPALTTVRQPMQELGARAARALDERITGVRTAPTHDVLDTTVQIRRSCGEHDKGE
jgi:LacI family transcriptional regulator